MTDHDHPDTDLTDPHGEAEALRKENARLLAAVAELRGATRTYTSGAASVAVCPICDIAGCHHLRATNALAASRAPDPVVNAGSCQPGDLISRAAAIEALGFAAWKHQGTDAYSQGMDAGARHQAKQDYEAIRALPAAPAADAATCLHLTADMAAMCPTCNPGLSTTLPDAGSEAQPAIGGAELDALVARLRSFDGDWHTRFAGKTMCESAADAITALRAQPDWKAMAERLGDVLGDALIVLEEADTAGSQVAADARAALSDIAKMKGE